MRRMPGRTWVPLVLALAGLPRAGWAVAPAPEEMIDAEEWITARCAGTAKPAPVFSFIVGGRNSAEVLKAWEFDRKSERIDDARTRYTLTWRDPQTGLSVRMVSVTYRDFPTVEWTVYLRNEGKTNSPMIENLQALDLQLEGDGKNEFVLHHQTGSPCTPADYEPHETVLGRTKTKRITATGGRPTNSDLSYFNLMWGERGLIVVVGWPGQWAAEFARKETKGLRIRAGQELTHFLLYPGEEVRTPLMVLQFHRGDRFRAQNIWRRWVVKYNLPRPNGRLVPTHYASCWGNMQPLAAEEIGIIDGFLRERIKLDYWIQDAGWYPGAGSWVNTGTWEPDAKRFRKGCARWRIGRTKREWGSWSGWSRSGSHPAHGCTRSIRNGFWVRTARRSF